MIIKSVSQILFVKNNHSENVYQIESKIQAQI
jgi:hypothetical protein